MGEHLIVLNDGETYAALEGSMIVEIVHDLERDPIPEDEIDGFLLDLEARLGCEIWWNEEEEFVARVITKFR